MPNTAPLRAGHQQGRILCKGDNCSSSVKNNVIMIDMLIVVLVIGDDRCLRKYPSLKRVLKNGVCLNKEQFFDMNLLLVV